MENFINSISENLVFKDGIWYSKERSSVSYPDEGNALCFQLEENSFWFHHRNNCIISVVNRFANKKILFDIGGGNGFTSLALENSNVETVLVEPGIAGIINAKKRNLNNLICSTLQDACIKKESIPNIGIFDVLEHIENDLDFLTELEQVLSNTGKLFITVPAFKFLWSADDALAGHFRRYTLKKLKNKLSKANFEIEYSTYIFSILPFPIFLFRTLPSLFRKKNKITLEIEQKRHNAGKLKNILNKIWGKEISFIQKNKKIPFGSSCLVVAKKKNI